MGQHAINHSTEPIRLFKSDFLEFFTHVHPMAIVVIWLPFALFFLVREVASALMNNSGLWYVLGAFLAGLFIWTLCEYLLHRFLFHFKSRSPAQERLIFLFHGIHHHQPQVKTRLVMPPVVSIPLAAAFVGMFHLVVAGWLGMPHWFGPMIAGFAIGYLIYDLMHYATHHFPMRAGVLKYLKRYHLMHHYKTPEQRYGVSSPMWDIVFRTKPAD